MGFFFPERKFLLPQSVTVRNISFVWKKLKKIFNTWNRRPVKLNCSNTILFSYEIIIKMSFINWNLCNHKAYPFFFRFVRMFSRAPIYFSMSTWLSRKRIAANWASRAIKWVWDIHQEDSLRGNPFLLKWVKRGEKL